MGNIELTPLSANLFENIPINSKAIFHDTLGNVIPLSITRDNIFYERYQRCDENSNDTISIEDPIVFQYRLQISKVKYSNDSLFSVNAWLSVYLPSSFEAISKENLLDNVADQLVISIDEPKPHATTLAGFVNNRNRIDTPPSQKLQFSEEIFFRKTFRNVYWDDKHTDKGDGYITYFNQEFGLVAITTSTGKVVLILDHIE